MRRALGAGNGPYDLRHSAGCYVRPAAERAAISKHITWHVFRHSFATQLKANGADVKVVQESLRHASSKITLDVYTQAIPSEVPIAQLRIADEITTMNDQENLIVPDSFSNF
jgi:integrase